MDLQEKAFELAKHLHYEEIIEIADLDNWKIENMKILFYCLGKNSKKPIHRQA